MSAFTTEQLKSTALGNFVPSYPGDDHFFSCAGCGQCYTTRRWAAKHCGVGCTDLRTGEAFPFCEEYEAAEQAAWEAYCAAEDARYIYECSCGERYLDVNAAADCRKCRTYTDAGFCTTVTRTDTGEVVWSMEPRLPAAQAEFEEECSGGDPSPLTHNPFAALLG